MNLQILIKHAHAFTLGACHVCCITTSKVERQIPRPTVSVFRTGTGWSNAWALMEQSSFLWWPKFRNWYVWFPLRVFSSRLSWSRDKRSWFPVFHALVHLCDLSQPSFRGILWHADSDCRWWEVLHAPCDAGAKYCTAEFFGEQLTHVGNLGLTTDVFTWDDQTKSDVDFAVTYFYFFSLNHGRHHFRGSCSCLTRLCDL